MKLFLTLDFKTMSNADFEIKCNLILTSMTGNKNFPKPTPALREMDAAIKKFSAAASAAADGGKTNRQARDQQRELVTGMLIDLKSYVEYESKGDIVKLTSTGFTVGGQKGSSSAHNEIKKFVVKQGKVSGTVNGSFSNVPWANTFGYDYTRTPVNDANWKTVPGGTCRFEISGLDRGVEYAIRVFAKSKTKIIYSNTLTILVV